VALETHSLVGNLFSRAGTYQYHCVHQIWNA